MGQREGAVTKVTTGSEGSNISVRALFAGSLFALQAGQVFDHDLAAFHI
jgi:hypothetical protein